MSAGLYIHIPFCESKCGYCDFFVVAKRQPPISAYLRALRKEILLYAGEPKVRLLHFETLYLGGGTPSLLSASQVDALINLVTAEFSFSSSPEITIEANPGTVDLDKLRDYRTSGVNRLSLGVQSFHPEELLLLDRTHSVDDVLASYSEARKAGFDNISLDLIFALPNQSVEMWQKSLALAIALAPEHISTYNLTFKEATPFSRKLDRGEIRITPENVQQQMFLQTIDTLQSHGYCHYEISNYAYLNKRSLHNQKYWDGSPYLGLGPSAHSFVNKRRFWNVRDLRKYAERLENGQPPIAGEEFLGPDEESLERVILGLRQRQGIHLRAFETELGFSFFEKYVKPLSRFFSSDFDDRNFVIDLTVGKRRLKSRFLEIEGGFLRLTKRGILLSDAICAQFV